MRTPESQRRMRKRNGLGSSSRYSAAAADTGKFTSFIGMAHVILGAVGLVSAGAGVLTAAVMSPLFVIPVVVRALLEGLTCYAGLMIGDGLRKGALLAIGTGVIRVVLLVFMSSFGVTLAVTVVLGAAVVWILPTLTSSGPVAQARKG